ncbi:protein NETWORKED 3A-like [Melia azedarach]|uniref:Protein NETWORKED 3A-like n=1 Tax=Melia azedarach TaxID=155640 RepID=A0ACC1XJM1_MELAZ|nr:protein NETWORKED 3A-like [Melia azedarach]
MAASTDHPDDEEQEEEQSAAVFLSRSRDTHKYPSHQYSQTQWLHTTLSGLDKKRRTMLDIMQDDGDSFAKRAEMYYKKRPELVEMVEDLHKSYRSLAENYDKLKSAGLPKFLSSSNRTKIVEDSNMEDHVDESLISKEVNNKRMMNCTVELSTLLVREKNSDELKTKVSKLLEDNLREQAELIRRNDEKRQVIKQLSSEINCLKDENVVLKNRLANYDNNNNNNNNNISIKVDMKHNQVLLSKFRKLFCGRF